MGNQHLPKSEPCPCLPDNLPHRPSHCGAAHGGEPCSPLLKASPPFTTPADIFRELGPSVLLALEEGNGQA